MAQRILDLGKEKVIKEVLYQRVDVVLKPQKPISSKQSNRKEDELMTEETKSKTVQS